MRQTGSAEIDSFREILSSGLLLEPVGGLPLLEAVEFLPRYTDADTDTDIHLIDNWGLTHALFHDSPALVRPTKGWDFAPGRSLADMTPAPYLEAAWAADPPVVFAVLLEA